MQKNWYALFYMKARIHKNTRFLCNITEVTGIMILVPSYRTAKQRFPPLSYGVTPSLQNKDLLSACCYERMSLFSASHICFTQLLLINRPSQRCCADVFLNWAGKLLFYFKSAEQSRDKYLF